MNRKTIAVPGRYDLDIGPILPIIDTPVFQRLRRKRQLENAAMIFDDANHTRFGHSLGTYSLTLERAALWHHDEVINAEELNDLALFALLHDIGHGPYSHATEALTGWSHHDMGLRLLDELVTELVHCGSSVERMKAFFTGQNKLAAAVTHRPLGTDKMDYLLRDARHTVEAVRFRVGDMLNHTFYRDGRLVIDRTIISETAQLQSDYVYMHDRVYLRRSALIAKRFFQKIVALEMSTNLAMTAEWLWSVDDLHLDAALLHSSNPKVRELFIRFLDRKLPKMAIALLPQGTVTADRIIGKSIATRFVDPGLLTKFDGYQPPARANELEEAVAWCAGLPPEAVLVIPVVTPERFIPDNVPVYDGSEYLGSLNELRPGHYRHLLEVTKGYAAVRVCVFPEYRERLAESRLADRIINLLLVEAITDSR